MFSKRPVVLSKYKFSEELVPESVEFYSIGLRDVLILHFVIGITQIK